MTRPVTAEELPGFLERKARWETMTARKPAPPEPICTLREGWCLTHDKADTIEHHFESHPDATTD